MNPAEPAMQNMEPPIGRSAIEVARHQYEQLYHKYVNLFEFSPIGFLVLDKAGLIQELNRVASDLFSIPRGKLIGRRIADFIHHDDQDIFFHRRLICQKEMRPHAFELKMKKKAADFMDVRLQLAPIHDRLRDELSFVVALTDISALMHLSSSAHLQQQSLELTNAAEDCVSLLNQHVKLIKTALGCDGVGVFIDDASEGVPCLAEEGLSREWIEFGCHSPWPGDAGPVPIVSKDDPKNGLTFFTPRGSFYINSVGRLFSASKSTKRESLKYILPDYREGYESVAMVPVTIKGCFGGTIHLVDRRENQFPLRVIETLELVAFRLGLAIQRFNLQEHLVLSQKKLDELSRHLLTIQEEEQRRIALELHDGCGQDLNVLKLRLKHLQNRLPGPGEPSELNEECEALLSLTDSLIDEIRAIAHGMKPAVLENLGLVPAIRQMFRDFTARYKIAIEKHIDPLSEIDDPTVQVCLYRIFQEALNNVYKHSRASRVLFAVKPEGRLLHIAIDDNGIGFNHQQQGKGLSGDKGMGLQAMALRCRMIGADLAIDSKPDRGTRLVITLSHQR